MLTLPTLYNEGKILLSFNAKHEGINSSQIIVLYPKIIEITERHAHLGRNLLQGILVVVRSYKITVRSISIVI